ncbi:MAG: tellurite resistance/C4-dicarboxylate transporter family protein [Actinomycetota bacterium]|nr:tellurite resistance/C4-dicarboxylate transporter family protein [Actinomycetota bacterium]
MGTGIVSIGLADHGWDVLSLILLLIDIVCYVLLVALVIIRAIRHPDALRADFEDPAKAFAFFTFVAASCVLGSRLAVAGEHAVAAGLLVIGSIAWLVLGYLIPWTALLLRESRGSVLSAANGTWFIWVVGSQAIAVLAATLQPMFVDWRQALAMLAVVSWSIGVFLYGVVGVVIVVRLLFYGMRPADFTPPYWVSMGATAITVVAGARIVDMANAPMVDATRALIAGTAVLFWALGTWLIPPLVIAGYWRHIRHKVPLRYEPAQWSIVFPLGMYGVGSSFLGATDKLPWVEWIGIVEGFIALAVWAIVFVAMLVNLWRNVLRAPRPVGFTAPAR